MCKNTHVIITKGQKCLCKIFWSKTGHQISKLGQKCLSQLIFWLFDASFSLDSSLTKTCSNCLCFYLPMYDDDGGHNMISEKVKILTGFFCPSFNIWWVVLLQKFYVDIFAPSWHLHFSSIMNINIFKSIIYI